MPTLEIFLALFIFILMVLVSIEDIATGFLFLLILIPLQHKELFSLVLWDVLPIRVAFFGIALTTFYRFYLWYRRYKKREVLSNFIRDPVLILLVLLYIVRLVSIIFIAENKRDGFELLAFYTTIVYFYILIKFLYLTYGYALIKKCLWIYSILAVLMGIVAVAQFVLFKLYTYKFGAIWDIPGHNPRVGSTFWDVNHFGAFVASALPISASFIFITNKYQRILWVFNTVFLIFILYLTQSRSAWLGFAVSSLVFVIFLFLKGFRKYARNVVIVGVVCLVLFFSYLELFTPGIYKTYQRFMHTRLDSFDTHFILVRGAYEAYSDNAILGGGYGNFNEAFRKTSYAPDYFFREKHITDQRVPSHSIWGEVFAETGFLGVSLYILFLFITIFSLILGYIKSDKKDTLLALALLTSISSLLISGIFYTYNLEFYWFILFFGVITGFYFYKDFSIAKFFKDLLAIKHLPIIFLSIFSALLLFWDLSKNKLIDWDEAIYAEVSKNIVKSGDFMTLQWYLDTPWFEKPPLYMWISSQFMRLFGFTEFAARAPSALFGLLGIITAYFFAKYIFKSRLIGFVSGLLLLTTAHYWYYARNGMLDVTVTFFILASLYAAYVFFDTKKLRFALFSGILCGLGVMTKAIVGLLPIPIIGVYLIYLLLLRKTTFSTVLTGVLVFLIAMLSVALPWHVYMYKLHGENFIKSYITIHILNRGLTNQQGKERELFWYLEVMQVSFRLWYIWFSAALGYLLRNVFSKSSKTFFLFVYFIVILAFFTISNSKLIWYLIPIYPVLAIITAYFIVQLVYNLKKYFAFIIFFIITVGLVYALDRSTITPADSQFFRFFPLFSIYAFVMGMFIFEISNFLNKKFKFINLSKITILKKLDVYANSSVVNGAFSIFFVLFLLLYIPKGVQDMVFVPDFNKDLVAVIEDYNEQYYKNYTKGRTKVDALYYQKIVSPVVTFYTQGQSIQIEPDKFKDIIDSAPFTKPHVFISRTGEYELFTELYGETKVTKSSNRGAYYLTYVRSEEEKYIVLKNSLQDELREKSSEYRVIVDPAQKNQLLTEINSIRDQLYEINLILHNNLPDKYAEPSLIYY